MIMQLRILVSILVCATLCACATSPVATSEAEAIAVPKGFSQPIQGGGKLVVTRDSGFSGGACSTTIYADGVEVGALRPGQKVELYVTAGRHMIGAQTPIVCGGGTMEAQADIAPGQSANFRTGRDTGGGVFLTPTAF